MNATVCRRASEDAGSGGANPARVADFEELFSELVEEAGRTLEADDLEWCALLQEFIIPRIETKGLGLQRAP